MIVYTFEQRWKISQRSIYRRCRFLQKKIFLFRWSSFGTWRLCKQAKMSHLWHRKPARIYWKADAPKTSHFFVRILVQRHNWAIFLRKWARKGRCSQWRSLTGHFERIFVHKNWRVCYLGFNRTALCATHPKLHSMFCALFLKDRIISRRADVIWPPRSCDLTPLDYYLWNAVKDKCYTDKP